MDHSHPIAFEQKQRAQYLHIIYALANANGDWGGCAMSDKSKKYCAQRTYK